MDFQKINEVETWHRKILGSGKFLKDSQSNGVKA